MADCCRTDQEGPHCEWPSSASQGGHAARPGEAHPVLLLQRDLDHRPTRQHQGRRKGRRRFSAGALSGNRRQEAGSRRARAGNVRQEAGGRSARRCNCCRRQDGGRRSPQDGSCCSPCCRGRPGPWRLLGPVSCMPMQKLQVLEHAPALGASEAAHPFLWSHITCALSAFLRGRGVFQQ